jgi:hypothetical protein
VDDLLIDADAVDAGEILGELRRRTSAAPAQKRRPDIVQLSGRHAWSNARSHFA